MIKIYYGALSRYSFNSSRVGSGFDIHGHEIKLIDSDWHKTLGSYKLVDHGDGTFSSFEINDGGVEYPISVNKSFNQKNLQTEIMGGYLVEETDFERYQNLQKVSVELSLTLRKFIEASVTRPIDPIAWYKYSTLIKLEGDTVSLAQQTLTTT